MFVQFIVSAYGAVNFGFNFICDDDFGGIRRRDEKKSEWF